MNWRQFYKWLEERDLLDGQAVISVYNFDSKEEAMEYGRDTCEDRERPEWVKDWESEPTDVVSFDLSTDKPDRITKDGLVFYTWLHEVDADDEEID